LNAGETTAEKFIEFFTAFSPRSSATATRGPGFEAGVFPQDKIPRSRYHVADALSLEKLGVFLQRDRQQLVDLEVILTPWHFGFRRVQ
jgi:hypothetical protein